MVENGLRIALVAPPYERVPPEAYGGTERIVHALAQELDARGHDLTVFASGDSEVAGTLVPTVPQSLRASGPVGEAVPWMVATQLAVLDRVAEFDVVHTHLDFWGLSMGHATSVPVVATFHGRVDHQGSRPAFAATKCSLVAISKSQAATHPDAGWTEIVYNGLDLSDAPFGTRRTDDLCFVGRLMPEKGILQAIEVARISDRRLRVAAKVGWQRQEIDYFENVVKPAFKTADVEHLGELSSHERDLLLAESWATLMPGAWPEPFGLVAIESLACGTPVLATRVGALPEIVREDVDGYFGDDPAQLAFHVDHVERLDRTAIRDSVLKRFSATRMADGYEAVYRRLVRSEAPPRSRVVSLTSHGTLDAHDAAGRSRS